MNKTSTNVDPNEVEKFNQLAENWWDTHGPMKPLHQLNPIRLAFIEKYQALHDKKIVDVGCGGGILTESLAQQGAKATGIDLAEAALAAAKAHAKLQGVSVDYKNIPVETFAKKNLQKFDAVSCMELLEHVPDPISIMQACTDLIKPGGKLFFSTINRTLKGFMLAIVGAEYVMNMLPKGTHQYDKFIRPSELCEWARSIGLTLVDLQGVHYNPLSGEFSLSQNVDVNYLVCFQK